MSISTLVPTGASTIVSTIGQQLYQLSFEISPIILVNGIASSIPGSMLPIVALTEAANFGLSILQGNPPTDLNQYQAHFFPLPGSTLIDFQLGDYPLANTTIAANAIITQALKIAMRMVIPVNKAGGYAAKTAMVMALQATLKQHSLLGGTYTVITPAMFYDNCLLLNLRDASGSDSKQPQNAYVFEFAQPLITQQQAAAAQGATMQQLTNQTPTSGSLMWSGTGATQSTISAPGSGAGALNLTGTNLSPLSTTPGFPTAGGFAP